MEANLFQGNQGFFPISCCDTDLGIVISGHGFKVVAGSPALPLYCSVPIGTLVANQLGICPLQQKTPTEAGAVPLRIVTLAGNSGCDKLGATSRGEPLITVLCSQFIQAAGVGAAAAHPRGFPVPADPATVPAATLFLQGFLHRLSIPLHPDPITNQRHFQLGQLEQLGNLIHDFLLNLVVVLVGAALVFHTVLPLQSSVVLVIDNLHGFGIATEVRVMLTSQVPIGFLDFLDRCQTLEEVHFAEAVRGSPAYLHILAPCVTGWGPSATNQFENCHIAFRGKYNFNLRNLSVF